MPETAIYIGGRARTEDSEILQPIDRLVEQLLMHGGSPATRCRAGLGPSWAARVAQLVERITLPRQVGAGALHVAFRLAARAVAPRGLPVGDDEQRGEQAEHEPDMLAAVPEYIRPYWLTTAVPDKTVSHPGRMLKAIELRGGHRHTR